MATRLRHEKPKKQYLFTRFAKNLPVNFSAHEQQKAKEWVRTTALKISTVNIRKLFNSQNNRLVSGVGDKFLGSMMLFHYDPKWKDELPYYDRFPMVIPIDLYKDGFLGLNLHYLPPYHRAKLMDALYTTINNNAYDDKTRFQVTYQLLKNSAKFRAFKPCVKRYLSKHVRSQFFFVEPKQWDVVLMLPLARFVKARKDRVWEDSTNAI